MIRAAGILFRTDDNRGLFLQRAGEDYSGCWCIPGGKLEDDETSEQAAIRESKEEAGSKVPKGSLVLLSRTISRAGPTPVSLPDLATVAYPQEDVDFTTYLQKVPEPFDVEIDGESSGFAWAPLDNPPQPLHPGVQISLDRLNADELGVARMMAAQQLTSPQRYENVTLFDIRITGTGVAWRSAHEEFSLRDPVHYLTPDFLARVNALPVLWEHPKKSLLDSKEWSSRVVGVVYYPYIKGDEVWAIAKIYDEAAASEMEKGGLSTSPCVNFIDPAVNNKVTLENGKVLLIEGKPSLLDHVAICEVGVWDKGGEPSGVNTVKADSEMTEEEKKAAEEKKARDNAEAKTKADAAAKADADRQAFQDSMTKFADSMTKRMDALEAKSSKADDDAEAKKANEAAKEPVAGDDEEAKRKEKADADKKPADAKKADGKRKDDDESEDEKKERERKEREKDDAAKAKADADMDARVKKIIADSLPKSLSDADRAALADTQAKADSVFQAFSRSAPRPLDGETRLAYRRRLATDLKAHSTQWKDIDLNAFGDSALDVVEKQIYADALTTARNPLDVPFDQLREVVTPDATGRQIRTFHGRPFAWMRDFSTAPDLARMTPSRH